MNRKLTRRDAVGALLGGAASSRLAAQGGEIRVAGLPVEIVVAPVSAETVRISLQPIDNGRLRPIPDDGSLVQPAWGEPAARWRGPSSRTAHSGNLTVNLAPDPLTIGIEAGGRVVQKLRIDRDTGVVWFTLGDGPILGMGQGGPQFDRRGSADRMRSGQGGYRLRTHGGRVPVPWLIGTSGWAMFFHQPLGTFDLSGAEGKFDPGAAPLPLDVFVVASREPAAVMAEWARLTGRPELPPLWSLGYQQSHRTLSSREEILAEAKTFREKKLPCDTLIYLGTGFTPSGWNTQNGSFSFNGRVFPDPERMFRELHELNFKVALHVAILARDLRGTARDRCEVSRYDEEQAGCYWHQHRRLAALGVDGWWPDEGDPLNLAARLARNRMYWEGPQLDRPHERPFALHRNGGAGMQRWGAFLWTGDPYSTWETLRTHLPVAVNTALSGIPLWGSDIGGFVPTRELTGELYVRWFQFGAFCPSFRAHGRTWKLRLPWGWNTGELGPDEVRQSSDASNPDPSELRNPHVEPICKRYLELRYRLLPYLYSALREGSQNGMPVIRGLWIHYPDDPAAVARGDQYLWGRDILVAPVTEKGATSRLLYLPRGTWYDFWTEEKQAGGREIARPVDLATMPLYVRAGAVLPMGPVKQYTGEKVDGPLTLTVYPGADGAAMVYEDDGITFDYRRGEWMGLRATWNDATRALALSLAAGSKMLPPLRRSLEVRLAGQQAARAVVFAGRPLEVSL